MDLKLATYKIRQARSEEYECNHWLIELKSIELFIYSARKEIDVLNVID
jgi:hypothetical protein